VEKDLAFLLDKLVDSVYGAEHAVVLATDGVLLAKSTGLNRADAEVTAASASSHFSLAKGDSARFGLGTVQQTLIEMDKGFVFVRSAGRHGVLAVVASKEVEAALMAKEMAFVVHQVGGHFTSAPRASAAQAFETGG
jgi:predicted regulator of Ras-like GTPase activity (Roadblock/LC7/MglB family)